MIFMGKKIVWNTHRMFKQACAFSDCAKCCEIEPNNIIEYRFDAHTVSGIVNSAFSCEVFIKTLLISYGVSIKEIRGKKSRDGHDLKRLWGLFRKSDSKKAEKAEIELKRHFNPKNENFFDEQLKIISDAFEHWRYIYETDEGCININFLKDFRILLRNVCCEQLYKKTWSEYIK